MSVTYWYLKYWTCLKGTYCVFSNSLMNNITVSDVHKSDQWSLNDELMVGSMCVLFCDCSMMQHIHPEGNTESNLRETLPGQQLLEKPGVNYLTQQTVYIPPPPLAACVTWLNTLIFYLKPKWNSQVPFTSSAPPPPPHAYQHCKSHESPMCDHLRLWQSAGPGGEMWSTMNPEWIIIGVWTHQLTAVPEERQGPSLSGLWPRRGQCQAGIQARWNAPSQMFKGAAHTGWIAVFQRTDVGVWKCIWPDLYKQASGGLKCVFHLPTVII